MKIDRIVGMVAAAGVLAFLATAPAGTPRAIRNQISTDMARVLTFPEIRDRLQSIGFHIAPSTPEEHEKNLRAGIAAFSKVVTDAGLRPK